MRKRAYCEILNWTDYKSNSQVDDNQNLTPPPGQPLFIYLALFVSGADKDDHAGRGRQNDRKTWHHPGRRVIYYDQRGNGRPDLIKDGSKLGFDKHVADLEINFYRI